MNNQKEVKNIDWTWLIEWNTKELIWIWKILNWDEIDVDCYSEWFNIWTELYEEYSEEYNDKLLEKMYEEQNQKEFSLSY